MSRNLTILIMLCSTLITGCRNYSSAIKVRKSNAEETEWSTVSSVAQRPGEITVGPSHEMQGEVSEQPLEQTAVMRAAHTIPKMVELAKVKRIKNDSKFRPHSDKTPDLKWQENNQDEPKDDEDDEPKKVSASIIGFIAVLVAILNIMVLMYIPFLGLAFGLLSIVFAIKALKIDDKKSKTLGVIALFISLFTLFISALATLLLVVGVSVFG